MSVRNLKYGSIHKVINTEVQRKNGSISRAILGR